MVMSVQLCTTLESKGDNDGEQHNYRQHYPEDCVAPTDMSSSVPRAQFAFV